MNKLILIIMMMMMMIVKLINAVGFLSNEKRSVKDIIKGKCFQLLFGWECFPCWHTFAHYVDLIIMDAFVDMFITLCILVNTVFMTIDHAKMDKELARTLANGNYVRRFHKCEKIILSYDQYSAKPTIRNYNHANSIVTKLCFTCLLQVFTAIFTVEAVLKVIALSPINYVKDKWNCFDAVIVVLSLVELSLSGVKGLSILRSFRLVCQTCFLI